MVKASRQVVNRRLKRQTNAGMIALETNALISRQEKEVFVTAKDSLVLVQRLYFIRKNYPETLNILFCLRNTEPNRQNVIKKIPQGNQS